ncbi:hypothetical protein Kisp01_27350 [Kineosporia sp. NBRC 101677]|nr:hypothetical protein Kisp01_27350 [Kineosporia sp. NBRC 101677]
MVKPVIVSVVGPASASEARIARTYTITDATTAVAATAETIKANSLRRPIPRACVTGRSIHRWLQAAQSGSFGFSRRVMAARSEPSAAGTLETQFAHSTLLPSLGLKVWFVRPYVIMIRWPIPTWQS